MKWVPGDSGDQPDKRESKFMEIIRPAAAAPVVIATERIVVSVVKPVPVAITVTR